LSTEKKGGENRIMQRLDNQLTAHRYIATQFVDYSSYQQSTHNYECPSVPHANRIRVLFISYTDADKKRKEKSTRPGSGICLPPARGNTVLSWGNRSRALGIEGRAGFGGAERRRRAPVGLRGPRGGETPSDVASIVGDEVAEVHEESRRALRTGRRPRLGSRKVPFRPYPVDKGYCTLAIGLNNFLSPSILPFTRNGRRYNSNLVLSAQFTDSVQSHLKFMCFISLFPYVHTSLITLLLQARVHTSEYNVSFTRDNNSTRKNRYEVNVANGKEEHFLTLYLYKEASNPQLRLATTYGLQCTLKKSSLHGIFDGY
jgi:hypothetical protein